MPSSIMFIRVNIVIIVGSNTLLKVELSHCHVSIGHHSLSSLLTLVPSASPRQHYHHAYHSKSWLDPYATDRTAWCWWKTCNTTHRRTDSIRFDPCRSYIDGDGIDRFAGMWSNIRLSVARNKNLSAWEGEYSISKQIDTPHINSVTWQDAHALHYCTIIPFRAFRGEEITHHPIEITVHRLCILWIIMQQIS